MTKNTNNYEMFYSTLMKNTQQPAPKESQQEGIKFDANKLQYHLIPPEALKALAEVLTYGANKYAPDNWKHLSNPINRYTSALFRHLEAWRSGEKLDKESHKPHLYHVLTNVAFLIWFEENIVQDISNKKGI